MHTYVSRHENAFEECVMVSCGTGYTTRESYWALSTSDS